MKLYKNLSTALKERNDVEALKLTLTGAEFPSELLMFTNLKEIYLEGETENFPRIGYPWEKLKILSVKWPKFKGDISGVFSLPSLENLKIIDTPLERLTLPIGQVSSILRSLTIKDCSLKALPEEISMLTGLQEMNLSGNLLTTLPGSFPFLKQLRRLNLDGNEFTKFPEQIGSMKQMSHLSIDGNQFSEEEKSRIQRLYNIWPN